MNLKTVTTMLRKGRAAKIAEFILQGNSTQDVCLAQVVDELESVGITGEILARNGAIISVHDLLEKLHTYPLEHCESMDAKKLLKHYHCVLSDSLKLWHANKNTETSLSKELDARIVNYLLKKWLEYRLKGDDTATKYFKHVESAISKFISSEINEFKAKANNQARLKYINDLVVKQVIHDWKNNNETHFSKIKHHLDNLLVEYLLNHAKAKSLEKNMQVMVSERLKDSLINHIYLLKDCYKFPGLTDNIISIRSALMNRDKNNLSKDHNSEIIEMLVNNYTDLSKHADLDINKLLRDEVIPYVIQHCNIQNEFKIEAVNILICDQRNNKINQEFESYKQILLDNIITTEIKENILQNKEPFCGVVERILREDVQKYKENDPLICDIMPNTDEGFADILSLQSKMVRAIYADIRVEVLEKEQNNLLTLVQQLREDNNKLKSQNEDLNRKLEDLSVMMTHRTCL